MTLELMMLCEEPPVDPTGEMNSFVHGKECAMNETSVSKGFESIVEYFKRRDWRFIADEALLAVQATFSLANTRPRCLAVVNEEDDLFHFVSLFPVLIPEEDREAIAEVCVRASWALKHGCFELNRDTGDLRFRTSLPYPKGSLPEDSIRRVITANLFTADTFFPAFKTVLYGHRSPAAALCTVEDPMRSSAPVQCQPAPSSPRYPSPAVEFRQSDAAVVAV
jgi:hypothetical protein